MKLVLGRGCGFALPTVLIASVIMLMLLTAAAAASSSVRSALNAQYYDQLATEAAESGIARATECIRAGGNQAEWWNNGVDLVPGANCDGTDNSGLPDYVKDSGNVRTTFAVGYVNITETTISINSIGTVELMRTSNSQPWRTHQQSVTINLPLSSLYATKSTVGRSQVCGIIDGETWCWGENGDGQLGDGTYNNSNVPVRVLRESGALLGKVDSDVAVGNGFACIVAQNEVYCMGQNGGGQLGNGGSSRSNIPVKVDMSTGLAGKTITQIVATGDSACALASGDVYCWGANTNGKLGIGSTSLHRTPIRVNTIGAWNGNPVTKIAATPVAHFVCAIASQDAWCWGNNLRGQLGDRSTTTRTSPVPVYSAGALGGRDIVDIAAGGGWSINGTYTDDGSTANGTTRSHTCAVTSDSRLYCWGSNQYGQLGQGYASLTPQTEPIRVSGGLLSGKLVEKTAVSYASTCALTTNNELYCWGHNNEGAVGDGTSTNRYSPVAVIMEAGVLLGETISDLSGGVNRMCVVAEGDTYCWGRNDEGQIGDGTNITRRKPTESIFMKQNLPRIYY